jgi:hypothetical protein
MAQHGRSVAEDRCNGGSGDAVVPDEHQQRNKPDHKSDGLDDYRS